MRWGRILAAALFLVNAQNNVLGEDSCQELISVRPLVQALRYRCAPQIGPRAPEALEALEALEAPEAPEAPEVLTVKI